MTANKVCVNVYAFSHIKITQGVQVFKLHVGAEGDKEEERMRSRAQEATVGMKGMR